MMNHSLRLRLFDWACSYIGKHDPDKIIEGEEGGYLYRWHIIPKNPLLSIYLHFIECDDAGRDLHDHRSFTLGAILFGGYEEIVPANWQRWKVGERETRTITRKAGDIIWRSPWQPHRLVVGQDGYALTLFVTGPTIKRWGFWGKFGWVYWRRYLKKLEEARRNRADLVDLLREDGAL